MKACAIIIQRHLSVYNCGIIWTEVCSLIGRGSMGFENKTEQDLRSDAAASTSLGDPAESDVVMNSTVCMIDMFPCRPLCHYPCQSHCAGLFLCERKGPAIHQFTTLFRQVRDAWWKDHTSTVNLLSVPSHKSVFLGRRLTSRCKEKIIDNPSKWELSIVMLRCA